MDQEQRERLQYYGFAAVVGVLLLLNLTGVWKTFFGIDTAAIVTVLAGYRTFYNAISALLEKQINADLALCIAVIAALSVGEYLAAAEAMFIILVGEGLESYAAGRTEAAIRGFVEQLPRRARVLRDGAEVEVDVASLMEGDVVVVRAGERITADGVVSLGTSSVDESTITGESLPRDKQAGDEVYSGTLNGNGLLQIRVARAGQETTLARVIALVEEARERQAPVQRLADRYAKYFLPALLIAGAATFYFTRDWLRTVAVLLVACPCALILATPTAMVAAIGGLARRGILVRGGTVLEQAARIDTVVFDKTGTVTEGRFEILRIVAVEGDENDLLRKAAAAESGSDHVLARVIVSEAQRRELRIPAVENARVHPGRGAECTLQGRMVRAGNAAFLVEGGIKGGTLVLEEADRAGATAVLVAENDRLLGGILLRDRIREGVPEMVAGLESLELTHLVMLTGDRKRAAEAIAREIGIPNVEAELLPEQKLERVQQWMSQGRQVAMLGDGINDAPALAAANVGVAVAGASDLTAEAADVVYMGHSLEALPKLIEVSRKAVTTAWQNILFFALLVNVSAVLAASFGVIGPKGAALTHQLSSFFVMMNSLRLLRVERRGPSRLSKVLGWVPLDRIRTRALAADPRDWVRYAWVHRLEWRRPAAYAALALLALNGFYIVGPDEAGVIERFGRKVSPPGEPGLHYKLPWPVEQLTRVQARRARALEIGFRSSPGVSETEPAAYEWNVQHRSGRFQRRPEEGLVVTGDQNLIELNASIHYRLRKPEDYLFRQADGGATVRVAGESAVHAVLTTTALDDALTSGRRRVEERIRNEMQSRLDRYEAGVEVLAVRLLDVHPSLEVVDAFRDVSGAFEEKNRLINEAEGYRNEQVAIARGNAQANLTSAAGYSLGRRNRADGDASRFTQQESAFRTAPGPTELRLYLESMEQVLPGKRKLIVDANKGRRHLVLLDDGVEIGGPGLPVVAPKGPAIPRED